MYFIFFSFVEFAQVELYVGLLQHLPIPTQQ